MTGARVRKVNEDMIAFVPRGLGGVLEGLKGLYLNALKFSPESISKIEAVLLQQVNAGMSPIGCSTIRSIIDHEMGHVIDALLKASFDKELKTLYRKTLKTMGSELCEYARTNISEFIAEGWSEYLNNPSPRPVAKRIGERLIELRDARKKEAGPK